MVEPNAPIAGLAIPWSAELGQGKQVAGPAVGHALRVGKLEGTDQRLVIELRPDFSEVGRVRHEVAQWLGGRGLDEECTDTVILLTSELVTNALRYGQPPVEVRASTQPSGIAMIEVSDGMQGELSVVQAATTAVHGRGLHMVDVLSSAWGCTTLDHGKCLWFQVPITTTQPRTDSSVPAPRRSKRIPSRVKRP